MFCPHFRSEICERKSWRRELPRYCQVGSRSHLSQNSTPETLKSDSTHQLACSLCHTRRWPASFPLRASPVHHLQPSFRFDPKLRAGALCRRLHLLRQFHDQEGQQRHLESTTANVDRILQFLTRHSSEEHQDIPNTCVAFDLPQSQLVQLERCLRAEGWEEKVRYDYDGTIGEAQLCLRMPSAIHEHFTQAVADEIQKELAGLVDRFSSYDERAALEIGKICKSRSNTLEYTEPKLVDCDFKPKLYSYGRWQSPISRTTGGKKSQSSR